MKTKAYKISPEKRKEMLKLLKHKLKTEVK